MVNNTLYISLLQTSYFTAICHNTLPPHSTHSHLMFNESTSADATYEADEQSYH